MTNPFARGAGIAAMVLVVLSFILFIAQNMQLENADDYEAALARAAALSWWSTFTFIVAIGALAVWTLLSGIEWIAARIAPGAFADGADPSTRVGEAEASARLSSSPNGIPDAR